MAQFSYKLVPESELFSFDFNPVLQPAETLNTAACTAITAQGTDPNPSAILSGTPTVSSGKANQRVIEETNIFIQGVYKKYGCGRCGYDKKLLCCCAL